MEVNVFREVTATQDQWQWVMFYMGNFIMPDKLGDKEYKPVERTRIQEEVSALFDDLLPHSYYAQQHGHDYEPNFGDKEDWEKTDKGFKQINPKKSYTVKLSPKAVSGLMWLFTVLLSAPERKMGPDGKPQLSHPYYVTPALASRFVWPIARELGKTKVLKRAVGIVDEPLRNWEEEVSK